MTLRFGEALRRRLVESDTGVDTLYCIDRAVYEWARLSRGTVISVQPMRLAALVLGVARGSVYERRYNPALMSLIKHRLEFYLRLGLAEKWRRRRGEVYLVDRREFIRAFQEDRLY